MKNEFLKKEIEEVEKEILTYRDRRNNTEYWNRRVAKTKLKTLKLAQSKHKEFVEKIENLKDDGKYLGKDIKELISEEMKDD